MSSQRLPFTAIGGVGLTRLSVYDQRPAPDGLMSGCPHIHAICAEAYYITRGQGRAELHDPVHGFRTIALEAGDYLDFPANVLHRIINDGGLEILGIMSNAGLSERGEARIYFGQAVDDDPAAYQRLVNLPKSKGLEGALERRDAAVAAYQQLLALHDNDRMAYRAELERFSRVHGEACRKDQAEYAAVIESGPVRWADEALDRLENLPATPVTRDIRHNRAKATTTFGMCGLLKPVCFQP